MIDFQILHNLFQYSHQDTPVTLKSSVHPPEVECSRFPEYPVSRIAVHSSSTQILFCDIQLRSTIQWIQPIQPVLLLRRQYSIQRYNGLRYWFDRNRSSNGLDQRCQDLRSLPKLEDKSGIDLQLSFIQGHRSPEVELPTTVDG